MKIFYNSKLAKLILYKEYIAIMLFGFVFTRENSLSLKVRLHEQTHIRQYMDCFQLGFMVGIPLLFILLACGLESLWLLMLFILPIFGFYILYGLEYLMLRIKGYSKSEAYSNISFEKHARWIASTWNKPCEKRNKYKSFGWYQL